MSLLSVAAHDLPVVSVAAIASPFDFSRVRLVAPIRPIAQLTGGRLITAVYRAMGGAPAPVVRAGYQLAALDKYLLKPLALARNMHDRDFLAQIEAVDRFTNNMLAYPGRTFGQLYHRFFIVNELAGGRFALSGGEQGEPRLVDLAEVDVPVLVVAGEDDGIAPRAAVHHVAGLLTGSPSVRVETAPGGHLGVLAGRGARRTTWRYLDEFLTEGDALAGAAPSVAA